jgi:preprotein translocase subunit SecG
MDNAVIFSLVVAVIFLAGIFWLVVYSRKQSQKHSLQTSIKPPEPPSKKRGG